MNVKNNNGFKGVFTALVTPMAKQSQIEQARVCLQSRLESLNASVVVRLTQRGQPASIMAKCVGDRRD